MTGRLVVQVGQDGLVIRKRYFPCFVAFWTLAVMGGIAYIAVTKVGDRSFGEAACLIGAGISFVFIALAVCLDRRPLLLVWSPARRSLTINGRAMDGEPAGPLRLSVGEVDFRLGGTTIHGEALYARCDGEAWVPVYVEHGRPSLKKKLQPLQSMDSYAVYDAPAVNFLED